MDRNDGEIDAVRQTMAVAIEDAGGDDCAAIVAAAVPFFHAALRRQCRIVPVRAGQVVFCRNEADKKIHRVLRGDVSVQREMMGEAVTLQRAAPGDWLIERLRIIPASGSRID